MCVKTLETAVVYAGRVVSVVAQNLRKSYKPFAHAALVAESNDLGRKAVHTGKHRGVAGSCRNGRAEHIVEDNAVFREKLIHIRSGKFIIAV